MNNIYAYHEFCMRISRRYFLLLSLISGQIFLRMLKHARGTAFSFEEWILLEISCQILTVTVSQVGSWGCLSRYIK